MSKRSPSSQDVFSSSSPLIPGNRYEIQHAGKSCWSALLICQECNTHPSHFSGLEDKEFFLHLYCAHCNSSFFVCTICPLNRKQFFTLHDISKHERLKCHQRNMNNLMKKKNSINEKLATMSDRNENHYDYDFEANDNDSNTNDNFS